MDPQLADWLTKAYTDKRGGTIWGIQSLHIQFLCYLPKPSEDNIKLISTQTLAQTMLCVENLIFIVFILLCVAK